MSVKEKYTALIEARAGVSMKELNSLNPREVWRKFHGNAPIKVKSYFPMIGRGGSVLHSVSVMNHKKLNAAINSLGK